MGQEYMIYQAGLQKVLNLYVVFFRVFFDVEYKYEDNFYRNAISFLVIKKTRP